MKFLKLIFIIVLVYLVDLNEASQHIWGRRAYFGEENYGKYEVTSVGLRTSLMINHFVDRVALESQYHETACLLFSLKVVHFVLHYYISYLKVVSATFLYNFKLFYLRQKQVG